MRFLIQCILAFILLVACCTPGGEEACDNNPYFTPFFCYVYDKTTKESIVGRCINCLYSNELSTLRSEFGDTISTEKTIDTDGAMKFFLVKDKIDSINTVLNKIFYLHFVDFNGIESDIDTIRFELEVGKINNCDLYEYRTFKCFFNDSLYLTRYPWNVSGGRVIFYK